MDYVLTSHNPELRMTQVSIRFELARNASYSHALSDIPARSERGANQKSSSHYAYFDTVCGSWRGIMNNASAESRTVATETTHVRSVTERAYAAAIAFARGVGGVDGQMESASPGGKRWETS
jgi:hypothetical protein